MINQCFIQLELFKFCSHVAANMPSSRGICMAPGAIAYRRKQKVVRGKIWKKGAIMDGNAHVAYMPDVPVETREEAEALLCKGFGPQILGLAMKGKDHTFTSFMLGFTFILMGGTPLTA